MMQEWKSRRTSISRKVLVCVVVGAIISYAESTKMVLGGDVTMGAWGSPTFENDVALDFLSQVRTENLYPVLQSAVSLERDAYIEEDEGVRALVVGELLAAQRDGDATRLPEIAKYILSEMRNPPPIELVAAAKSAVEMVLRSSETRELRAELGATEFNQWQDEVRKILKRLQ
jgi:hypothetical protein